VLCIARNIFTAPLPIEEGRRVNMVVWLRSSTVRNELCPMCDRKPTLVPCNGYGDGFQTGSC
jgi:hypothetical protein